MMHSHGREGVSPAQHAPYIAAVSMSKIQLKALFCVALPRYMAVKEGMRNPIHSRLLAEVDAYLERTKTAASSISTAAVGHWDAVKRIRDGKNVTTNTADALRRVMFEHPDGISGTKDAVAIRRKAVEEKRKVKLQ
jgi:hypothetical protein